MKIIKSVLVRAVFQIFKVLDMNFLLAAIQA